MYKKLVVGCLLSSLVFAPLAWGEDHYSEEDDSEMSSELEAVDAAEEQESEVDEAAPVDESEQVAPMEDASTTQAQPDRARAGNPFDLNDGGAAGDGPPATLENENEKP